MKVTVNKDGDFVLDAADKERLHLQEGQQLVLPDPEDAWFWTPEWQEKERAADADIAAGRVTTYANDEEFLASLKPKSGTPHVSPV
jgi:hypothetical protein